MPKARGSLVKFSLVLAPFRKCPAGLPGGHFYVLVVGSPPSPDVDFSNDTWPCEIVHKAWGPVWVPMGPMRPAENGAVIAWRDQSVPPSFV